MKKKNTILCIVAHPDDEALGVGGSLIKHVQEGDKVFIVILSEGEEAKIIKNEKNPMRKSNAKQWAKLANCSLYKLFDFPDQKLDSVPQLEIVKKIEKVVEEIRPSIVYIHHPGDINLDHQIVAQTTLTAIRPMSKHNLKPEIRAFETPSSTDQAPMIGKYIFSPNYYVCITDQWDIKLKGLKIYSTELKKPPHPRSENAVEALAMKRGAESGFIKAEAFMILRKFWE